MWLELVLMTQKGNPFFYVGQVCWCGWTLHVTPYYNKPTPEWPRGAFKSIAKATALPIILYNVPGRTGSNVSPFVILRIAREVPEVVAVKEASGSLNQMMEIINGVRKMVQKILWCLREMMLLFLPLDRCRWKGCISVVCKRNPKIFSDMIHYALKRDWVKANKLHYQTLDLMNVNFIESNRYQ